MMRKYESECTLNGKWNTFKMLRNSKLILRKAFYLIVHISIGTIFLSFVMSESKAAIWAGTAGDDTWVETEPADDFLTAGGGDDYLDGGHRIDTAVYYGTSSEYKIDFQAGAVIINDIISGRDGKDTLLNIEKLQFSDVAISLTDLTIDQNFNNIVNSQLLPNGNLVFFNNPPSYGQVGWTELTKDLIPVSQQSTFNYGSGSGLVMNDGRYVLIHNSSDQGISADIYDQSGVLLDSKQILSNTNRIYDYGPLPLKAIHLANDQIVISTFTTTTSSGPTLHRLFVYDGNFNLIADVDLTSCSKFATWDGGNPYGIYPINQNQYALVCGWQMQIFQGGTPTTSPIQLQTGYYNFISNLSNGNFTTSYIVPVPGRIPGGNSTTTDVYVQIWDQAGNKISSPILVAQDCWYPKTFSLPNGGFVVMFVSNGYGGGGNGAYFKVFDAQGNPITDIKKSTVVFGSEQQNPDGIGFPDGSFLTYWNYTPNSYGIGIGGMLFNPDFTPKFLQISGITGNFLGGSGDLFIVNSGNGNTVNAGAGDSTIVSSEILFNSTAAAASPKLLSVPSTQLSANIVSGSNLVGGSGDNIIYGRTNDTAIFSGKFSEYATFYSTSSGYITVIDQISARDGSDRVKGIGNFKFSDLTKSSTDLLASSTTPIISATPISIDFSTQPPGKTITKSLMISNTGNSNLNIKSISISGVDASSFGYVGTCSVIAPQSNCNLSVSFSPTSLKNYSASLNILSNFGYNKSISVPLTGLAVSGPIISITPSSISFANQLINTTSASQTLTIRNVGSATLTISSFTISGTNASAFTRSGSCTSIAINASCSITMTFRPTTTGAMSATLAIASNASGTPTVNIPMSGTGIVTTISLLAGNIDGPGFINGTGTAARFFAPTGIAIDASNNLYVTDTNNSVIRRITSAGLVSTLAGAVLTPGATTGTTTAARFNGPTGIAINGTRLVIADTNNQLIRSMTTAGAVSALAGGAGIAGSTNSTTGSSARFNSPQGVAVDASNNAFIADTGNSTIRRVTSTGSTSTFAGAAGVVGGTDSATATSARFSSPIGIGRYSTTGNLYVADSNGQTVRTVTTGAAPGVSTLAGTYATPGSTDASGASARFSTPSGATVDTTGNIFVADSANGTIRKITSAGAVTTFAGTAQSFGSTDATGSAARFYRPVGMARDSSNNLFVADPVAHTIRKIDPSGVVSTFAGSPAVVGANDNTGSLASFRNPSGTAVDSSGNLYIVDTGNHTIRKVSPVGEVTTFAGTAGSSGSADGDGATARFNGPTGITIDGSGNLYVTDTGNHTIRKITSGGTVTTIAGTAGSSGSTNATGTAARFKSPSALVFYNSTPAVLYVADTGNYTIRKIDLSNSAVTTLAGSAGLTGATNGTGSTARFGLVYGIGINSTGSNLYVADYTNQIIRQVTSAGAVTTFAGTAGSRGTTNGTGTAARFANPYGLTVDASNIIYVGDYGNCLIRRITTAAAVTTPIGTAGTCKFTPANAPSTINSPIGLVKRGTTLYFTAGNGVAAVANMP